MTAVVAAVRRPLTTNRALVAPVTLVVLGLIDICLFGTAALVHKGDAAFLLSAGSGIKIPAVRVAAAPACFILGAISVGVGVLRGTTELSRAARRLMVAAVLLCFVLSLLCWADAGHIALNVIIIAQGTFTASIPLILGALAGCLCERAGVINIAIEGQLLFGAFTAAIVASAFGGLWVGLVAGSLAGGLVGTLLAVFAITFLMDQIILGVVLNGLILGLTGYLYDDLMVPYANTLNSPPTFNAIKIPLLADIPIIGPVFFQATIFLYLTYLALALVQVGLFNTRWGLRTRAVGEHPVAADTVGIRVYATRYRNVIAAGVLAGIGGAYLTIGSVGSFAKGMSSGEGYIALAAMIFGRYTPFGAIGAALLFGFSTQLQSVLSTMNVPIQSNLLLATPYVVTIIVVAGLVGKVRPPRAEGIPYIKA